MLCGQNLVQQLVVSWRKNARTILPIMYICFELLHGFMVKARIRHLPWGFEFSFLHPNKWIFQTQTISIQTVVIKGFASYKMDNTNTGTYITPTIGIRKVLWCNMNGHDNELVRLLPQDQLSCYPVDPNLASRSKVHKVLTFRRDGIPSFSLGKKSVKDLQPALKFRTSCLP